MSAPARLIDLSIARPVEDAARSRGLGTDYYMSPEQADPDIFGAPGHPADVWGLGATLFHAVAGYRAFDKGPTKGPLSTRYPQLVDEPYGLPDHVPADVVKLIESCLVLDPVERPSPASLVDAFGPILELHPRGRLGGFKSALTAR